MRRVGEYGGEGDSFELKGGGAERREHTEDGISGHLRDSQCRPRRDRRGRGCDLRHDAERLCCGCLQWMVRVRCVIGCRAESYDHVSCTLYLILCTKSFLLPWALLFMLCGWC